MKKYKVVKSSTPIDFEADINELARNGWRVISANLTYQGLGSNESIYFALLENTSLEDEIQQILEENATDIDEISINPSPN